MFVYHFGMTYMRGYLQNIAIRDTQQTGFKSFTEIRICNASYVVWTSIRDGDKRFIYALTEVRNDVFIYTGYVERNANSVQN